jgi:acetoin utilization protein AcuC
MKSFFIYSDTLSRFEYSPNHPFRPERAVIMLDLCKKYGLIDEPWISIVNPDSIPDDLLLLFHTNKYLETLRNAGKGIITDDTVMAGLGTSDNPIFSDMFEKTNCAAGGTLVGLSHVMDCPGRAVAFNPIGGFHHAFPDYAEGFCYLNDIAVAGRVLRRQGKRFAYIDIDAHHGNGVQAAFWEDDGALVISMHQSGYTIYPGTGFENEIGQGKGRGYTINVPVPPQTDDDLYLKAFRAIVPQAIAAFSPDVILAQLGADSLANDPLTNLSLTNNGIRSLAKEIGGLCEKIVGMGGGGYNLGKATRAWTIAWAALNNIELENPYAGILSGVMSGPEIEGGDLSDPHIYITGPTKERNEKDIDRVVDYIRKTVFPIIGAPS